MLRNRLAMLLLFPLAACGDDQPPVEIPIATVRPRSDLPPAVKSAVNRLAGRELEKELMESGSMTVTDADMERYARIQSAFADRGGGARAFELCQREGLDAVKFAFIHTAATALAREKAGKARGIIGLQPIDPESRATIERWIENNQK